MPSVVFSRNDVLYQSLFEKTPAIHFLIDPQTCKIVDANKAACHFYGYDHLQLTTMRIGDLISESEVDVYTPGALVGQHDKPLQCQHRLASGDLRDVQMHSSPIEFHGQQYLLLYINDISEHKKTEKALSRSQDLYRRCAQNMPNSSVVMFDTEMRHMLAEGPLLQKFGDLYKDFVGKTPQEVLPKELAESILPVYRRALQGESFRYERVTEAYAYESHANPLYDEDGNIIGGMILSHDTSERQLAKDSMRAALEEVENRYQAMFNSMVEGVFIHDKNGILLNCNPAAARILDLDIQAAIGTSARNSGWDAIHEDGSPFSPEDYPTSIAFRTGQEVSNVVMGLNGPNRTLTWLSLNASPLMNLNETQPYAVLTTMADITADKHREDALQRSMSLFRSTFDHAAIGMALVALDGHWLQVNPAGCEIVGYSEAELQHKTSRDLTHPDDLQSSTSAIKQLLAGEIESFQLEKRYIHKLGYAVWVLLSVSLVRDTEGKPVHFISQIQNITTRKQVEQALVAKLEQEIEFQRYLRKLHEVSIELSRLDTLDDFYRRVVEFGLESFGFERFGLLLRDSATGTVIGTYGTDAQGKLADERHIRFAPKDLTGILARAYESEDFFVLDTEAPLFDNFRPIGTGWNAVAVIWNGYEKLGWLAVDNGLRHQAFTQGKLDILGLFALSIGNLLAQKRSQADLIEQRNLLRMVIDSAPDYIFLKDLHGHFLLSNIAHTRASGCQSFEEIIGKTNLELVPLKLAERFIADDAVIIESGEPLINVERESLDALGNLRTVLTSKIPWRDSTGHIIGVLGISRDISDLKRLENIAREKDRLQVAFDKEAELGKLKTRMMERIVHEFRTPLAVIQSTAETLTAYFDRLTPDQRLKKAQIINDTNSRLGDMLDEISLVLQGSQKPLVLQRVPTNLLLILQMVARTLELQFNLTGKFVFDIPDNPILNIDPHVLNKTLFHIMHNATLYSPPDTPVIIRVVLFDTRVIISVEDKGIGIPADEQSRIFEPFFRGTNINERGGLGVGLTIAQWGILAHSGKISVASTESQGTTVTIEFPLFQPVEY